MEPVAKMEQVKPVAKIEPVAKMEPHGYQKGNRNAQFYNRTTKKINF